MLIDTQGNGKSTRTKPLDVIVLRLELEAKETKSEHVSPKVKKIRKIGLSQRPDTRREIV